MQFFAIIAFTLLNSVEAIYMQVILLDNVAKVGKKYEVIDVAPGYGRNFLLPRGLAEIITKKNVGHIASLRSERALIVANEEALLGKALAGAKDLVLTFTVKANEQGHLFAGITREAIAEKLSAALSIEIDADTISLPKHIKEVGDHGVDLVVKDKKATFTVRVAAETVAVVE